MTLAPHHLLRCVVATFTWHRGCLDALAVQTAAGWMLVQTAAGWMLVPSRFLAHLSAQTLVDLNPGAVTTPLVEVGVNVLPRRILFGQVAPLTAGHRQIQHAIDDASQVHRAWSPTPTLQWKQIFDMFPLTLSQIARVILSFHNPNLRLKSGSESTSVII